MDELEAEYKGKIDVVRFSTLTDEGRCEYLKHNFPGGVPAFLYISASGRQVEKIVQLLMKDELQPKLENLLKQP